MKTIAVTGGDVSGKSDSWILLSPKLKKKILQVPEIATALMTHALPALGRDIEVSPDTLAKYQTVIHPAQLVAEDTWKMVATAESKRMVWCDRGIPDLVAYDPGGWPAIEHSFGLNKAEIFARYDHVIVLRSLATINPAKFLEVQQQNPTRALHPVEFVQDLDRRTFEAWHDHPGLIDIDCTKGMEAIIRQVEEALSLILGQEIEHKFVLPTPPDFGLFENILRLAQRQFYLVNSDQGELRCREETVENGPTSCIMTTKSGQGLVRNEYEDYDYPAWAFAALANSKLGQMIEKTRHVCQVDSLIYEVDLYHQPAPQVVVEVNFDSVAAAEAFVRPSWLEDARQVTNDPAFKAKNVALNGGFPKPVLV